MAWLARKVNDTFKSCILSGRLIETIWFIRSMQIQNDYVVEPYNVQIVQMKLQLKGWDSNFEVKISHILKVATYEILLTFENFSSKLLIRIFIKEQQFFGIM